MSTGTRRSLIGLFATLLVVALVGVVHVWTSLNGRGGREVEGERRVVRSLSGGDIVYYVRTPPDREPLPLPVVLLASFARSVADFNELSSSLAAAGYETVAIESRGIGGSSGGGPGRKLTLHDLAADIAAVLDAHSGGRSQAAHVVGHAFGNRVVRTFARDRPTRVASVTLIGAGGLVPLGPEITNALLRSVSSFLPWSSRKSSLRRAFFSAQSDIPKHWIGGWWLWGGLAQMAATGATPSEAFWDGGDALILVLQAADDTLAPPADSGLRLAASFPERVELVMVPAAGHALLPEQPEPISRAILRYYERF